MDNTEAQLYGIVPSAEFMLLSAFPTFTQMQEEPTCIFPA